jgi:hypothetical protein
MKKILIALVFSTFTYAGADAQIRTHCGMDKGYVCHVHGETADCYKTNYAQNFPVCKGPNGYYICCNQDAAKQQDCTDNKYALIPATEKRTVVCERNGNMIACYETEKTSTTNYTRVNTD